MGLTWDPRSNGQGLPLFGGVAYATAIRPGRAVGTSVLWRFGVVGEALPIDDDAGLVADDPCVVAGRQDGEIAGTVFHFLAAVGHDEFHSPGDEVAGMRGLAAIGLRDGLDVLGPAPAWLESRSPYWAGIEVDQFELACVAVDTLRTSSGLSGLWQSSADMSLPPLCCGGGFAQPGCPAAGPVRPRSRRRGGRGRVRAAA
jgi:hypothetical protein